MATGDDHIEEIPRVSGRAADVSVTLAPMPFRQTESGRRFASPDFGPDFIVELHERLPARRSRGLFRPKLVCPMCGTNLDAEPVGRMAVAVDVALKRLPSPIRVELEMPGVGCPGCHRTLVNSDDGNVDSDLSDALIDAFRAGDIRPG
ncbi:MAG TPA: hypothetical protein VH440_02545 [Candidatus Limnocylindrales bacterium]